MTKASSKGTIVLVDDDPKLRRLYSDFLAASGYVVMSASGGIEAINLVSRVKPKVVLLDIMMPELDGIETCRRIRQIIGYNVPILFLTSLDNAEQVREGLKAGGHDYILKSGSLKPVLDRVQHWSTWSARGSAEQRRARALDDIQNLLESGEEGGELDWAEDAVQVDLREFLARALATVPPGFGTNRQQTLYLLGYVAGAVDHELSLHGDLKPNLRKYIRETLRSSAVFSDTVIGQLVDSLDRLVSDEMVRSGWKSGQRDKRDAASGGPEYVPQGLIEFKIAAA